MYLNHKNLETMKKHIIDSLKESLEDLKRRKEFLTNSDTTYIHGKISGLKDLYHKCGIKDKGIDDLIIEVLS